MKNTVNIHNKSTAYKDSSSSRETQAIRRWYNYLFKEVELYRTAYHILRRHRVTQSWQTIPLAVSTPLKTDYTPCNIKCCLSPVSITLKKIAFFMWYTKFGICLWYLLFVKDLWYVVCLGPMASFIYTVLHKKTHKAPWGIYLNETQSKLW